MVKVNRLFNIILIYCNVVKFSEALAYSLNDVPDCFYMLQFNNAGILVFYALIVFSTDYSLIICVVCLFLWSIRAKNKANMLSLAKIVEVLFKQNPYRFELFNDQQVPDDDPSDANRRRASSDSIKDYMMYSN
jgi:hypothetical protein